MIDEIYPRLFLGVLADGIGNTSPGLQKLIEQHRYQNTIGHCFGSLVNAIYRDDPQSDIGLKYGRHLCPEVLCDYSRLMMTSKDTMDLLRLLEEVHPYHDGSYYPFVEISEEHVSIAIAFPYKAEITDFQRRFCCESIFAFTTNVLKRMSGKEFTPPKIRLDFPRPSYASEYVSLFGDNVRFDAGINLIEFESDYLKESLQTRDSILHQTYRDKCLLADHPRDNFVKAVALKLIQHHPESFGCPYLANLMNLSVRGLQNRLNKSGVTFSEVSSWVRRELSKKYLLQERRNVAWTGDLLGFESLSGFNRYFQNTFGMSANTFVNRYQIHKSSD